MILFHRIALVILFAFVLTNCSKNVAPGTPSSINTGAQVTLDFARSLRVVEDGIRQANASGVASDDTTKNVLLLTSRLNKAGLDANAVLRSQTTLTVDQRVSVGTLLSPLVNAIQLAVDQDVVKISNPTTRSQVQTALLAIQATIKTTLAALAQP